MIIKKGSFNDRDCCSFMHQILQALHELKKRKIMHRDMKPENILLQKSKDNKSFDLFLCDLGLAAYEKEASQSQVKCGTPGYIAPEVL